VIARFGDFVREIDVRRLTTRSTNYEVYEATGTISGTALDPSDRAAPKAGFWPFSRLTTVVHRRSKLSDFPNKFTHFGFPRLVTERIR
jgi:hypothetical protein